MSGKLCLPILNHTSNSRVSNDDRQARIRTLLCLTPPRVTTKSVLRVTRHQHTNSHASRTSVRDTRTEPQHARWLVSTELPLPVASGEQDPRGTPRRGASETTATIPLKTRRTRTSRSERAPIAPSNENRRRSQTLGARSSTSGAAHQRQRGGIVSCSLHCHHTTRSEHLTVGAQNRGELRIGDELGVHRRFVCRHRLAQRVRGQRRRAAVLKAVVVVVRRS